MSEQVRIRLDEEEQAWLNARFDGGKPGDWTHKVRALIQETRARESEKPDLLRFSSWLKNHSDKHEDFAALASAIKAFYKAG
jgi:hypothetical protein